MLPEEMLRCYDVTNKYAYVMVFFSSLDILNRGEINRTDGIFENSQKNEQ